jgi:hypothetical protein
MKMVFLFVQFDAKGLYWMKTKKRSEQYCEREEMEKYNKVYLALWLLFSAIVLLFMLVFLLGQLAETLDSEILENAGLALSFLLLFVASEIVGFVLATLAIDRISWAYCMNAIVAVLSFHNPEILAERERSSDGLFRPQSLILVF